MVEKKLFHWIGGKKWLEKDMNEIFSLFVSSNIDSYAEPFAGGLGSFLYSLDNLSKIGVKNIYLNDVNIALISFYNNVKVYPKELFIEYKKIENIYAKKIPKSALNLNPTKDKVKLRKFLKNANIYYYARRKEFNRIKSIGNLRSSALFMFLLRHCFNSVYRENMVGGFNSPYNWEVRLINEDEKLDSMLAYSKIFNDMNVNFYNMDCFDFIKYIKSLNSKVLIYFDPPYYNAGMNENKYNQNHFNYACQLSLLDKIKSFDNVVFSNHDHLIFKTFCKENKFDYKIVYRKNNMSVRDKANLVSEILAYRIE